MMHLAWFANFTTDHWNEPFGNGGAAWNGRFHREVAQAMERACFDFMMFEDSLMIPDVYQGSHDADLKHGLLAPKGDPAPLAAMLSGATSEIGLVATMSTLAYPPFLLARLASTIDSLSDGRFGWNIVTSAQDTAAQNFGLDALPEHEERYARADEYLDLVTQLWRSWDPDAVVNDRERGVYVDGSKVRPIHFEGQYYKCRGPLNCAPSPQHVPTLVQAGGSPTGRNFAARHADAIVAGASSVEKMKAFRADIRARAVGFGRDPDEIKVLFLAAPVLGTTTEEAEAAYAAMLSGPNFVERKLATVSALTDLDFAQYDLHSPLPGRLTTNGEQGTLDAFQQFGSGKTLYELATAGPGIAASVHLVGTPDDVAEAMGRTMEEVGGDGFLLTTNAQTMSRRQVIEICDGLVPALQRKGLARTRYEPGQVLRDRLRAF
jgi:FMN-dependent oxidoreductase (nitrilotriacetate monooxygenase family)